MERFTTFLGKHVWLQVTLSTVIASALVVLLFPESSVLSAVIRTALISVMVVVVVLAARREEKRAVGGTENLVALERKVRKGDVPADPAERDAMRGLVDRRLYRSRHRVAALVLVTVVLGSITALSALAGEERQAIGFSLFAVAFTGWSIVNSSRQHRRLTTMDAALRSGGATEGSGCSQA
ncbi:hypothetical protein ACFW9L_11145 [Streptomyces sp. NPDC059517]|uniref:hypothetical protein n=1 Tax=Streptomyces sp. NPDC059517 TaxID=3346855 RepID=UPI0036A7CD59